MILPALFDSVFFRRILGHYPTGVCAITALKEGNPIGMIVGSFTSASLDPPLVAFFPDRKSTTWPHIRHAGQFCINILAADQQDACRALSAKGNDKFANLSWHLSQTGLPVIAGAAAWIECDLHAVHEAGDHDIAIGLVRALDAGHADSPLLFHQGRYGRFCPVENRGAWKKMEAG